jgi:hypothetical protein
VESPETRRIPQTLAQHVGPDANAAQIAALMVGLWQEIEHSLSPIIGKRGVAALYRRSLYLTGVGHAWLASASDGVATSLDLVALHALFAQQTPAAGMAAGGALLQTFYELLASMVGPSLTARLLRGVWANSLSGPSQEVMA